MKIPEGYQHVMPYLIIENAVGFMGFMKNVFGAKEVLNIPRSENLIMHAEVKVGDSTIMFADATEQFKIQPAGMFIYVENADETYATALRVGASALSPLADQEYGRSGGVTDPHGNVWWITSPRSE